MGYLSDLSLESWVGRTIVTNSLISAELSLKPDRKEAGEGWPQQAEVRDHQKNPTSHPFSPLGFSPLAGFSSAEHGHV